MIEYHRKPAVVADESWMDEANCAGLDPDLFFPEMTQGGGNVLREAKEVCAGCVVREECLAFALETEQRFGLWGGLSPAERTRIRRQRKRAGLS